MRGGWLEALTAPETFFEREGEDPPIRGPLVVVGTIALVGTLTSVVTFQAVAGAVTGGARNLLVAVQVFAIVVGLFAPFVIWLAYAVVFYVVSAFLDGGGSFRDVAVVSAWGFLPRVFGAVVDLLATVVATRTVTVGPVDSPADFGLFAGAVSAHPASLAAGVVGIGLLLWSARIWIAGLQQARRLDRGEALVAVAIPVGIALLFRLFGLLGAVV